MKKRFLFVLPLLLLNSCGSNASVIKTICPFGAPSVCYYSEINNDNFLTQTMPNVVASFQTSQYDAIVVDATSGLNAIRQYKKPYAFAKLLTAGNLFIISNKEESATPKNGDKIIAFGSESALPYLALKKYCIKSGKVDFATCPIELKRDVSEVGAILKNDMARANFSYQYYVIADPLFTSLSSAPGFSLLKKKKLLSDELGALIPQASLFINKDTYQKKATLFSSYLNDLRARMDKIINHPDEVAREVKDYNEAFFKEKFGFSLSLIEPVQKHNGFALFNYDNKYGMDELNSFLQFVDYGTTFDKSYFIDV